MCKNVLRQWYGNLKFSRGEGVPPLGLDMCVNSSHHPVQLKYFDIDGSRTHFWAGRGFHIEGRYQPRSGGCMWVGVPSGGAGFWGPPSGNWWGQATTFLCGPYTEEPQNPWNIYEIVSIWGIWPISNDTWCPLNRQQSTVWSYVGIASPWSTDGRYKWC